MTPREFAVYYKGKQEEEVRLFSNAITVAWQAEIFARENRLSDKTLKKVLAKLESPKVKKTTPQSEEQIWHMIKAINAGVGGTVKKKGKAHG